jgi:Ca-activated chloride channel homolog
MFWETPFILFFLWLVPLVGAAAVYAQHKRVAATKRFVDEEMFERIVPRSSQSRVWWRAVLLMLAAGFLIVACARPRFGVYIEEVTSRGVDLFVLLDVSRSMLAEDVAPNRLERAKSDIRDLLQKLKGDRVGLIVFAGAAVELIPLTTDHGFFQMVLDSVDVNSAPRGGSLIGDAIRKSIASMPEQRDRDQVIVLITDGEDQDSFPAEAADQAAERNIRIISVGLGDAGEGARIPSRGERDGLSFVQHEGQEVWSKMDETLLKDIALKTDGAYIPAQTRAYDLGQIYDDHLAGLAGGESQSETRRRYRDQFQLFGGIGLAFLLLEMLLPRFSKAVLVRCLFIVISVACLPQAAAEDGTVGKVRQGVRQFDSGEFEAAATTFGAAAESSPENMTIVYDRACALSAAGDIEDATDLFKTAALARDTRIASRSHYNLGCLAAEQGRSTLGDNPIAATGEARKTAIDQLMSAVTHYRDCLRLDPHHKDARHNLELIRMFIKHVESEWDRIDREREREEKGLLEFLAMIEKRQADLRQTTRQSLESLNLPQRSQLVRETAADQTTLRDEIEPLKQKLTAELAAPPAAQSPPAGGQPPAMDEQTERALQLLLHLADEADSLMQQSSEQIRAQAFDAAATDQKEVLDRLNQIFMVVAQFPQILQRAIKAQETLTHSSEAIETPESTADIAAVDASELATESGDPDLLPPTEVVSEPAASAPDAAETADFPELAWQQSRVTDWSRLLSLKAEATLPQIDEQLQAMAEAAETTDPPDPAQPNRTGDPPADEPDPAAQLEAMKRALEKGVELAPLAQQHSETATEHLGDAEASAAQPEQQEVLRLLKEIAQELPPPEDQQQDQPDDQEDQQGDEDQQQQDQSGEQPDDAQDQQQSDSEQDQESEQQQEQSEQSRKERAMSVLRRAQEREREHRELEKQLQQLIGERIRVERDW